MFIRTLTVFWKIYLIAWILFRSFTLGIRLLFDFGPESTALVIIGLFGFVPLIGFIFVKPMFRPGIWRAWLVFLLVWALVDRNFYSAWYLWDPFDSQIFGLLLAIPGFAAIYVYSRPTFSAWNAITRDAS